MEQLNYLEEERKKIWERISELESEIRKKTSDCEAEAKQSSKKTTEYKNKSEISFEQIKTYENIARQNSEEITTLLTETKSIEVSLKEKAEYVNQQFTTISNNEDAYSSNIESLEEMFENFEDLKEKIDSLGGLLISGEETLKKINQLFKASSDKRNEINELYLEIVGSEDEDKDGKKIVVPGLKDDLESSYEEIEQKVNLLQRQLDDIISINKDTLEKKIIGFEETFEKTNKQIESLLPNALTTGLSYAYFAKRTDEEKEERKQTKYFTIAIIGMIMVSLILFGVSTYQLFNGVALYDVLMQLPRVVLAILPLYIPVLWFAYSANKKRNLSKRLIEEYTHKEVLSKTFEGLSTQIDNIEENNISLDLRNRLLYNVLEVTSNNPGKLISDYNKSDHPFMDVLDKSTQLVNSIDKLSKIPGAGKLITVLERKAKKVVDKVKDAERGLDTVLEDDEN